MKAKLLASLLAFCPLAGSCGEVPEPECLEYKTIVEIPFTKEGGWEIDNSWFNKPPYQTGCFVQQPPCPADTGNHYMLSVMRSLRRKVKVPPRSNIDKVAIQGNAYSRDVTLELVLEDYPKEVFTVDEPDDCSLDVMAVEYWKKSDSHQITADGVIYLSVSLADVYSSSDNSIFRGCGQFAPEMPTCPYSYEDYWGNPYENEGEVSGCIGLSKILLQQCVRKKIFTDE